MHSTIATATTATTIALALAALAGCAGGNVDGEIDGDFVPNFRTGMVVAANQLTDDDDEVALAVFTTFSDGCGLLAEHLDVKAYGIRGITNGDDVEELIDDVRDFEETNLPDDYWVAYVVLAGENQRDIEDNFNVEDDAGGAIICHHTGAVDAPRDQPQAALLPDFLAPTYKDANRECYAAEEGEIRVSLYDGKAISLVAEVELIDDEGDDAGEVRLSGMGGSCAATADAVDGLLEELEDMSRAADASTGAESSCQWAHDGVCDEPGGTNVCAAGTDSADC